jgi:serine/threonine protein kinase
VLPFQIPISQAAKDFPEFEFVAALTPSEQKAAFQVRDGDGKDLCLKIIAPDYELDRLNREIAALQKIDHKNVVSFIEYTYSSTPNRLRHYIVEEFVEGSDLAEHLGNNGWAVDRAAKLFAELADGLDALRIANVVHRDLKPNNIRIREDDSPVIIDFGLARHLTLPDLTYTAQGAGIGTPLYFSPEQFSGTKRDIDHRTDLFAIGVILYEALTGAHPFYANGMTRAELEAAVCNPDDFDARPAFDALPNQWKLVIRRLLATERGKRFNSAAQLASLIRKIAP